MAGLVWGRAGVQDALLGRDSELDRLRAGVLSARRRGQVVLVEGEAGIGKSSLVGRVADEVGAAGFTVLGAAADPLGARLPLGLLADLLRSGGAPLAGAAEAVADLLRRPGPEAGSGGADVELRISDVALAAIDDAATRSPVCVVVEDLQWADSATLTFLSRLIREVALTATALVLTRRPVPCDPPLQTLLRELDMNGAERLVVRGLDRETSHALAGRMLGMPAGPRLADRLDGAAGNPLFVGELLGSLTAAGAVRFAGDVAELDDGDDVPTLSVAILRRLSHLSPQTLDLLRTATVSGRQFDVAELAAVTGRSPAELVGLLQEGLDGGALAERDGGLIFRHHLIQDALYHDLPASGRRALHRAFAAALSDAGASPGRVAEHIRLAALPGDRHAAQEIADAARATVDVAPGVAVELLDQAVEVAGDHGDALRAELAADRALALVRAGHHDGAEACRRVLAQRPRDPKAGPLHLAIMESLVEQARMAELVGEVAGALCDDRLSPTERLVAQAWESAGLLFTGRRDEARAAAEIACADGRATGEDLAYVLGAGVLVQIEVTEGKLVRAADRALEAARYAGDRGTWAVLRGQPHSTVWLPLCLLDRLDEARALTHQGRVLTEGVGLLGPLGVYHFIAAFIDWLAGRWDNALAELEVNSRLAVDHSWAWRAAPMGTRALILLHRDDLDGARAVVQAAEAEVAAGRGAFGLEILALAGGLVDEAFGDRTRGLARLTAMWDGLAALGVRSVLPVLGPDLARMAVEEGDRDRAVGVASDLEALAYDNPGVPTLDALALRVRGLAEDDGELLLHAVERQRDGPRPLELGVACETAARWLIAHGRGAEAGAFLTEAAEQFEALGAARDLRRLDSVLRMAGVRRGVRGRRGRPKTGWGALTETELRVVRLVAERLTNPEIASRMFLSRRTVQTHVSSALRKLGVSTRRELADVAAREAGWRLRLGD